MSVTRLLHEQRALPSPHIRQVLNVGYGASQRFLEQGSMYIVLHCKRYGISLDAPHLLPPVAICSFSSVTERVALLLDTAHTVLRLLLVSNHCPARSLMFPRQGRCSMRPSFKPLSSSQAPHPSLTPLGCSVCLNHSFFSLFLSLSFSQVP